MGSDNSSLRTGLTNRNVAHRIKATSATLLEGECFYTLYPSRDNKNELPNKLGVFEDLQLYCGFSFDRSKSVEALISTENNKSLFDWSVYISQLEKTNIRGCDTLREKQLVVVG